MRGVVYQRGRLRGRLDVPAMGGETRLSQLGTGRSFFRSRVCSDLWDHTFPRNAQKITTLRNGTNKGWEMDSRYDIYKSLPEDRLLWINRVKALDDARTLVAALQASSRDHYLVYDFRERMVVEVFAPVARVSELVAA